MSKEVRVRFAPSPTGPLNIGGLRTALYDYLYAKKHGGTFILRIEDTDANRAVPGTEKYILEALSWAGITPDEGPDIGGDYGPYRQSERKALYQKYAEKLISLGCAYYAFDTAEELDAMRKKGEVQNGYAAKYGHQTRGSMRNSLTISAKETEKLVAEGKNVTIRLKFPKDKSISFKDQIRGAVTFHTNELDDKVIMKADGMPTYHLANIVDDKLMKISHVIRGEEWLSSTAHHIFMYDSLGWEKPEFAHLSLILKPLGKGKLSKRDSAKFGFPVFPLNWKDEDGNIVFEGFKEYGFMPEALVNFLAFLGWNPGTEQEIFDLEELSNAFSMGQMVKSGARFDIEKAKWYNQQYIKKSNPAELAKMISEKLILKGYTAEPEYITQYCSLMQERVTTLNDLVDSGHYFFEEIKEFDEKIARKKYKNEHQFAFDDIRKIIRETDPFEAAVLEEKIKAYINQSSVGFNQILPILRVTTTGTMKGPDLFETMALLGKEKVLDRLASGIHLCKSLQIDK